MLALPLCTNGGITAIGRPDNGGLTGAHYLASV